MYDRVIDSELVRSLEDRLRDVRTEDLPALFETILINRGANRHSVATGAPQVDPPIHLLFKWGLLSPTSYRALAAEYRNTSDEPVEHYPCLSDIARYTVAHWQHCPDFEPAGLGEIVVILKDYGWTLTGPTGPFTLEAAREREARRKIGRRQAQRSAEHRYYDGLLEELKADGLSIKELAERHGRSATNLGLRLRQHREWLRYCEANPLPEPANSDASAPN